MYNSSLSFFKSANLAFSASFKAFWTLLFSSFSLFFLSFSSCAAFFLASFNAFFAFAFSSFSFFILSFSSCAAFFLASFASSLSFLKLSVFLPSFLKSQNPSQYYLYFQKNHQIPPDKKNHQILLQPFSFYFLS